MAHMNHNCFSSFVPFFVTKSLAIAFLPGSLFQGHFFWQYIIISYYLCSHKQSSALCLITIHFSIILIPRRIRKAVLCLKIHMWLSLTGRPFLMPGVNGSTDVLLKKVKLCVGL